MLTLLLIIWVVCQIVEYHEDRCDWREQDVFDRNQAFGLYDDEKYGDTYNVDVNIDARQVHLHGGTCGDQRGELPPEV